jgi:hypothetical protein
LMAVSVGVSSVLLLHVYLLSLVSHDKHLGSLVLDVLEGGECRRLQRSASSRRAPQTCPWR